MHAQSHLPDVWGDIRAIESDRNVLFVCPKYPLTFWSWHFASRDLLGYDRGTFAPPLDLLTVAAFFPESWSLRLVDTNIHALKDEDLAWADMVVTCANKVQMDSLEDLVERTHRLDKPVVLGGLDPSMRPHFYEMVDYLHIGLVGDATQEMILALEKNKTRPKDRQVFVVTERLQIQNYPPPRYDLIDTSDYMAVSIQFAVGCPFMCEFCEVAQYYGRKPMVKRPEQILHELQYLFDRGYRGIVVFVDDNFIGNIPVAKETLSLLVQWQKDHNRPFRFYASASANLAERPDLMDLMYEAGFFNVFVGIETPKADDLRAISKTQNTFTSTLDIISTIHSHRIQVTGAFILGFDTDGENAGDDIFDFVEASTICTPILSLLTASQGTALYNRLLSEGRLITQKAIGPFLDSNVLYRQGQADIFKQYVETYRRLYEPRTFFRRVRRNMIMSRVDDRQYNKSLSLRMRLRALPRILWHMGIKPSYRWAFWKLMLWSIVHRKFNYFAYMSYVGYHYFHFAEAMSANPPIAASSESITLPAEALTGPGSPHDYARPKDGPMVYAGHRKITKSDRPKQRKVVHDNREHSPAI